MLGNIQTITTSTAIQRIVEASKIRNQGFDGSFSGMPVILLGEAGCGKTAGAVMAAKELGYQCQVTSAMYRDPTEISGARSLPTDGGNFVKHFWPDWSKDIDRDKGAIIVFDEVTKAPQSVRNALYGQTQERVADSFEWGRDWFPVFTGNVSTSRAGDTDNPGPLRNRCGQWFVKNEAANLLADFALPHNLHHYVTSCVKTHAINEAFPNGILNTWDGDENPAAFASERSWSKLADVCDSGIDPRPWAYSMLGNEVGNVFAQHYDLLELMPDIDAIRRDPLGTPVPEDIAVGYYVGNMVAYWASPQDMDAFCAYAERMPAEIAATAVSEIVRRHPECMETSAYIKFRTKYKLTV